MDAIYAVNALLLSVFLTLFVFEVGVAMLSAFAYDKYRDRIRGYLMPIWEVTGTFAVFYLVNLEASFPTLLVPLGSLYVAPLLAAVVLITLRNAFLAYSEYIGDLRLEQTCMKAYSFSTIVASFIVISTAASAISGAGANLQSGTLDLIGMFGSPFGISAFVSLALVAAFMAANHFEVENVRGKSVFCLLLGGAIAVLSVYYSLQYDQSYALWLGAVALLALLGLTLYLSAAKSRRVGVCCAAWLFGSFNLLAYAVYPRIFGGAAAITDYANNSAVAGYIVPITLAGGLLVAAGMSYLVYLNYVKGAEY